MGGVRDSLWRRDAESGRYPVSIATRAFTLKVSDVQLANVMMWRTKERGPVDRRGSVFQVRWKCLRESPNIQQ